MRDTEIANDGPSHHQNIPKFTLQYQDTQIYIKKKKKAKR